MLQHRLPLTTSHKAILCKPHPTRVVITLKSLATVKQAFHLSWKSVLAMLALCIRTITLLFVRSRRPRKDTRLARVALRVLLLQEVWYQ